MKYLVSLLLLTSLFSCSNLKKVPTQESEKAKILIPSYTGNWVSKNKDGSNWYLRIYEETHKTPVPIYTSPSSFAFGQVVALLKFVPSPSEKDQSDMILRFSGARINESKVFLGGESLYELGIPTRNRVLKFKIPEDLKDGLTVWLEDARTGGIFERIPENRNHDFIKLKFKRLIE